MERKNITALGQLAALGAGGEGTVYSCGADASTVLKQYHANAAITVLDGLLPKIAELAPVQQAWVRQRCCLPTAIVEEAGKPVGILMPRIPSEFHFSSGNGGHRPRELQYLLYEHFLPKLNEPPPSGAQRLELCRQWADTMAALHSADVIIGDISTKNWLWNVHPHPAVYLIDCDSYRVVSSRSVLPQLHSPDWNDPDLRSGAQSTKLSDSYKLALLCIRVLLIEPILRPSGALERLRQNGPPSLVWMIPLLERVESGQRPTAQEWADALAAATGAPPPQKAPVPRSGRRTQPVGKASARPSDRPTSSLKPRIRQTRPLH